MVPYYRKKLRHKTGNNEVTADVTSPNQQEYDMPTSFWIIRVSYESYSLLTAQQPYLVEHVDRQRLQREVVRYEYGL